MSRIWQRRAGGVDDLTDAIPAACRQGPYCSPLVRPWSCSSRLTCCGVIRWRGTKSRNRKAITQCNEAKNQKELDRESQVSTTIKRPHQLHSSESKRNVEPQEGQREWTSEVESPSKELRNKDSLIRSAKVNEPELPIVGVVVVSIKCRCAHGVIVV